MHIECIGFFSVQLYILQRWQRLVSYLKLICSGNWSNHNTTCLFFVYLFWRGGVVLYIRFRYIGTLLLPFLIYIQLFTLLTKAFPVNRSQCFFSNMSLTIYSIACLLCEVQNMKSSCQVLEIHCCLITYKTDQYISLTGVCWVFDTLSLAVYRQVHNMLAVLQEREILPCYFFYVKRPIGWLFNNTFW